MNNDVVKDIDFFKPRSLLDIFKLEEKKRPLTTLLKSSIKSTQKKVQDKFKSYYSTVQSNPPTNLKPEKETVKKCQNKVS